LEQKNYVCHPPDRVAAERDKLQNAQARPAQVKTVDAEDAEKNREKQRGALAPRKSRRRIFWACAGKVNHLAT
jgi:hypothetical protein